MSDVGTETLATGTGRQKLSVNLTDQAAGVVRELAETQGITVSEVIRRAISLEQFIVTQLRSGANFYLSVGDGQSVERVHFVFG